MKKMILIGLAMVAVLLICNNGYAQGGVPLPKDIVIKPPSPELPKEIATFSGKWKGTWVKGAPMADFIIVVTEIDLEKAEIIYAQTEAPSSNMASWCTYETARVISGQKFQIQFKGSPARFKSGMAGSRAWYTFEMQENLKTLKGVCEWPQGTWKATLEKIE
jgi:hypothetical protein